MFQIASNFEKKIMITYYLKTLVDFLDFLYICTYLQQGFYFTHLRSVKRGAVRVAFQVQNTVAQTTYRIVANSKPGYYKIFNNFGGATK